MTEKDLKNTRDQLIALGFNIHASLPPEVQAVDQHPFESGTGLNILKARSLTVVSEGKEQMVASIPEEKDAVQRVQQGISVLKQAYGLC